MLARIKRFFQKKQVDIKVHHCTRANTGHGSRGNSFTVSHFESVIFCQTDAKSFTLIEDYSRALVVLVFDIPPEGLIEILKECTPIGIDIEISRSPSDIKWTL